MSGLPLEGLPPLDPAGAGASVLPKPFSSEQLVEHIRLALRANAASAMCPGGTAVST
jgi:DNA-binding response OmpR family regulator